jgi:hypothetical protein
MEGTFVDSIPGRQLSWALMQEDSPGLELSDWDNTPHPLVFRLEQACGANAIKAAHEWRRYDDAHPMSAVVEWMIAGSFKGSYYSDADFCADFFGRADHGGSLMDHLCTWDGKGAGFAAWPDLSPRAVRDLFDWDEWAYQAMNREGAAFRSLPRSRNPDINDGVFVWDVTGEGAGEFAG